MIPKGRGGGGWGYQRVTSGSVVPPFVETSGRGVKSRAQFQPAHCREAYKLARINPCVRILMLHVRSSLDAHLCRHRHRIKFCSPENLSPASRAAEISPRRSRSHAIGGRRFQRRTPLAGSNVANSARAATLPSCHARMGHGCGESGGNGGAARRPQFARVSGMGPLHHRLDHRNRFRIGRGPPHSPGHRLRWSRGRTQRSAGGPRWRQLRAHPFARGTTP